MSNSSRLDLSPDPHVRELPGAFPTTPGEYESPPVISSQLSLSQAVHQRQAEYTVPRKVKIKVGTWNVAALHGTELDLGAWFVGGKGISESLSILSFDNNGGSADTESVEDVAHQEARRSKDKPTIPFDDHGAIPGGDEIGLYALGLQEIVDISSPAEALRPYNDPHPGRKWKRAVENALPSGYTLVAEQQLIGLYLVVYAAPVISSMVSSVSTTSVRTGLMGYMGNKGAVVARIVLGETTRIVFVNCHLCAGAEKGNLERRNWDASQVQKQTKFNPVDIGGLTEETNEGLGDEDFAFWFGDLNYRLEGIPGEDVRRLLLLHTKNEYTQANASKRKIDAELALHDRSSLHSHTEDDSSSHMSSHTPDSSLSSHTAASPQSSDTLDPSSDPASLQTTLTSLLSHDQLHHQMRQRKAFHEGWREGPIDFLPTYKYDAGSVGMFDSSEKKRGPSWCDRILFRTRRDKHEYDQKVRSEEAARKRDHEMEAHGIDDPAIKEEEVLFDYDPTSDGADDEYEADTNQDDPAIVTTKAGFEDKIHLEYYTSHQRVLSSDHKPLDAVFTLSYEAVDPDLKAKVHQEVARELDRAENERRPTVTVIVDPHQEDHDKLHLPTDHESVHFGNVQYASKKTRNVTIANTGRVPATLGFTDRITTSDHGSGVTPPWLDIHLDRASDKERPTAESHAVYTLEPGDAVNVELTIRVDDIDLVRALNDAKTHLEDVLVLRVHNGRDYFLPVHATWLHSSFGRSIDNLIRIPEGGVRSLQHDLEGGPKHGDGDGVKWSAPRELFRLTEAIEDLVERAVAEWGMRLGDQCPPWEDARWPFIIDRDETKEMQGLRERVREALDHDEPVVHAFPRETDSIGKVEAVAETLLAFSTSIEGGVVTEDLWTEIERSMMEQETSQAHLQAEDERVRVLDILVASPAHSTSFTFVTSMLAKVVLEISSSASTYSEEKGSIRRKLEESYVGMFADALIKAPLPTGTRERKRALTRRRRIIEVFIGARVESDLV
ncbi:MAG: hypothetical protein Q9202_003434 [Teloschistes flavicans]